MEPPATSIVHILQARLDVLRVARAHPLPPPPLPSTALPPHPHVYAIEQHAFHLKPPSPPPPPSLKQPHAPSPPTSKPSPPASKPKPSAMSTAGAAIQKPATAKSKRIIAKWTPDMDRVICKLLTKYGWGCWSLIASSGKLPLHFSRKVISNRAKVLGLTRDMYDTPNLASPAATPSSALAVPNPVPTSIPPANPVNGLNALNDSVHSPKSTVRPQPLKSTTSVPTTAPTQPMPTSSPSNPSPSPSPPSPP